MIRLHIPGFYDSDSGKPRWGDGQIIDDGKNYFVIDGYCEVGADRLINRLKERKIKTPYLIGTHAHYDHLDGLRKIINNSYFKPKAFYCQNPEVLKDGLGNGEIKSDYNYLKTVIAEAKKRNIPVIYVDHGSKISVGDINIKIYRYSPKYQGDDEDPHGWAFVNDGSLCCWFPNISYWTSGDGPERIYDLCKSIGAKPKFFKIPHHGNNCPRLQANGMKSLGALYCWDNSYDTSITDFLMYGRNRCIEAGIKFIDIHGDINAIFFSGKAVIYKGSNIYRHSCSYKGSPTITAEVTLDVIKNVLMGKYGNDDDRNTKLLNANLNPGVVQREINTLYKLIKG